jgi:hypothetical protein
MAIFLISAEVLKLISDITCPAGAILTSSIELCHNSGDAGNTNGNRQLERLLMGNIDVQESVEDFSSPGASANRAVDHKKNLAFQKVREFFLFHLHRQDIRLLPLACLHFVYCIHSYAVFLFKRCLY